MGLREFGGVASGSGPGLVVRAGRVVEPDDHRSADWVPIRSGSSIPGRLPDQVGAGGTSSDRPLHAERIRRSWEAGKCAARRPVVRLEEVASGEWRVTSLKKKQMAGVEAGATRAEVGVTRSADSSGGRKARAVGVRGRSEERRVGKE